jgi:hypothetical protein
VHWAHVLFVLQTLPVGQSEALRHATQTCGWTMVSHTEVGALQSVLLLHGWLIHVPIDPSVTVQYSPVGQLVAPPSVVRQPAVQTPVAVVEVSQ